MTAAPSKPFMIYGAYGYTGRLAVDEAKARGLAPVIAGRDAQRVHDMARATGLPGRVFSLEDAEAARKGVAGMAAVLGCAGPFSATAQPLLDACIANGASYLDITGEIDVFEAIFARDEELRKAGITAIPGVGFDVVPTDGLAALLKERLPSATTLTLAFHTNGGAPSPGTAKTAVEGLGQAGRARKNGRIVAVPGVVARTIPFPGRVSRAVMIPWGDVATAYRSTGIPDIEVYMGVGERELRGMRALGHVRWLLKPRVVQRLLQKLIEKRIKGPTETQRARSRTLLWGEVSDATGKRVALGMTSPEGYTLTARSSIAAVSCVLAGGVASGALTPSLAFGTGFITGLDGIEVHELQ